MIKFENITKTLTNPIFYLILSNFLVLIFALLFNWNIGEIIWTFLIQNIIIGFFTFLRIIQTRTLQPGTGQDAVQNRFIVKAFMVILKLFMGGFFLLHYGGFQLAYMVFLLSIFKNVNASHVLISGALFLIPHFLSYRQKLKYDRDDGIKLFRLMFIPYLRIIPMHLIIFVATIIGPESKLTLCAFIVLKTIADVKMHLVERKLNEEPHISFDDVIKNAARKLRKT
jgi:hypothetical protein